MSSASPKIVIPVAHESFDIESAVATGDTGEYVKLDEFNIARSYVRSVTLPEPRENTFIILPLEVAQLAFGRSDILSPVNPSVTEQFVNCEGLALVSDQ